MFRKCITVCEISREELNETNSNFICHAFDYIILCIDVGHSEMNEHFYSDYDEYAKAWYLSCTNRK